MTLSAAFERMQSKAWKIHPLRVGAAVQRGQDTQEFRNVILRHPSRASLIVQAFQATMPKRFDHLQTVWCLSTIVNNSGESRALPQLAVLDRHLPILPQYTLGRTSG